MSAFEKAKKRILSKPKDYTYAEARELLTQLGFQESNKERTSGSRVKFFRESDKRIILLHKPHPEDGMSPGAVRALADFLKGLGEI